MGAYADKYVAVMSSGTPDADAFAAMLAEDVRWYEAGNAEATAGKAAVLARLEAMGAGEAPEVTTVATAEDDTHFFVEGVARWTRGSEELEYRFVERHTIVDGLITERRAYMDAVPADVAAWFGG